MKEEKIILLETKIKLLDIIRIIYSILFTILLFVPIRGTSMIQTVKNLVLSYGIMQILGIVLALIMVMIFVNIFLSMSNLYKPNSKMETFIKTVLLICSLTYVIWTLLYFGIIEVIIMLLALSYIFVDYIFYENMKLLEFTKKTEVNDKVNDEMQDNVEEKVIIEEEKKLYPIDIIRMVYIAITYITFLVLFSFGGRLYILSDIVEFCSFFGVIGIIAGLTLIAILIAPIVISIMTLVTKKSKERNLLGDTILVFNIGLTFALFLSFDGIMLYLIVVFLEFIVECIFRTKEEN